MQRQMVNSFDEDQVEESKSERVLNLKVVNNLFESKMKKSDPNKSDSSNDFASDSLELENGESQSADGGECKSNRSLQRISDDLGNLPLGRMQPICSCSRSVLLVDDTEFNIIPIEQMLKAHF